MPANGKQMKAEEERNAAMALLALPQSCYAPRVLRLLSAQTVRPRADTPHATGKDSARHALCRNSERQHHAQTYLRRRQRGEAAKEQKDQQSVQAA
jgi:hypothetical protein